MFQRKTVIPYNTRDGNGNEIKTEVQIKQYPLIEAKFTCPICGNQHSKGCEIKKVVSANFTDWDMVGDYICPECADLFSLYFYNYVVDPDGIRLINMRELPHELTKKQKIPFMFCITTSRKKHLFYTAKWNKNADYFAVNLERETIYTSTKRMQELLDFVECLYTLGASKQAMADGYIPFETLNKVGCIALIYLQNELKKREIQIPLYCGQKREIPEEEAICIINSILTK